MLFENDYGPTVQCTVCLKIKKRALNLANPFYFLRGKKMELLHSNTRDCIWITKTEKNSSGEAQIWNDKVPLSKQKQQRSKKKKKKIDKRKENECEVRWVSQEMSCTCTLNSKYLELCSQYNVPALLKLEDYGARSWDTRRLQGVWTWYARKEGTY